MKPTQLSVRYGDLAVILWAICDTGCPEKHLHPGGDPTLLTALQNAAEKAGVYTPDNPLVVSAFSVYSTYKTPIFARALVGVLIDSYLAEYDKVNENDTVSECDASLARHFSSLSLSLMITEAPDSNPPTLSKKWVSEEIETLEKSHKKSKVAEDVNLRLDKQFIEKLLRDAEREKFEKQKKDNGVDWSKQPIRDWHDWLAPPFRYTHPYDLFMGNPPFKTDPRLPERVTYSNGTTGQVLFVF